MNNFTIIAIGLVVSVLMLTQQQQVLGSHSHHHTCKPPYTMLYSFTSKPEGFCTLLTNGNGTAVDAKTGLPFGK